MCSVLLNTGSVPKLYSHSGATESGSTARLWYELIQADVPSVPDQRQQLYT